MVWTCVRVEESWTCLCVSACVYMCRRSSSVLMVCWCGRMAGRLCIGPAMRAMWRWCSCCWSTRRTWAQLPRSRGVHVEGRSCVGGACMCMWAVETMRGEGRAGKQAGAGQRPCGCVSVLVNGANARACCGACLCIWPVVGIRVIGQAGEQARGGSGGVDVRAC